MQKISEEWLYLPENCFAKSFLEQILFNSFAQESNFTKFNVLSPRRPLRKITTERPKFKSVKVRPLPLKTDLIVMPGDLDAWELSLLLPTIKFFFETFFRFLQLTRNLTYRQVLEKQGDLRTCSFLITVTPWVSRAQPRPQLPTFLGPDGR